MISGFHRFRFVAYPLPSEKGIAMNWRLLWLPTLLLLASRTFVEAQQAGKVSRVGWLSVSPEATFLARYNAFRQGLRDLGYVEGQNIVIEYRDAKGKLQRLPDAAAELVRCRRRLDERCISLGPPYFASKMAKSRRRSVWTTV